MPRIGSNDSFDVAGSAVPTKVNSVNLQFSVADDGGGGNVYSGRYEFAILDADGLPIEYRKGNLVPHLTQGQIDAITSFLDTVLTKAKTTIPV